MSYGLTKVEIGKVIIIHIMVIACIVILPVYTKKTIIQVCMYVVYMEICCGSLNVNYWHTRILLSPTVYIVLPDESLLLLCI